jgi:hypothetical protein
MHISKEQLVKRLHDRGDFCRAELVEQQLPTRVDLDEHAEQLRRIGLAPEEILKVEPESRRLLQPACGRHYTDEKTVERGASSEPSGPVKENDVQANP